MAGTRALVLGGGGTVGLAWHAGFLSGLQAAGTDITGADLIVGTSAGALIGLRLAYGDTSEQLLSEQLTLDPRTVEQAVALQSHLDIASVMKVYALWAVPGELSNERRLQIGALALAARTPSEAEYLPWVSGYLQGGQPGAARGWPARRVVVTGVDVESGAFNSWDSLSAGQQAVPVPVERAVAASCAVPGLWPPVSIAGRRYMDGGVGSATNALLARDCERVLILAPIGSGTDALSPGGRYAAEQEAQALRAAGSRVLLIYPDARSTAAFGPLLMAADRGVPSAREGVRQGREAAAAVAAFWNG